MKRSFTLLFAVLIFLLLIILSVPCLAECSGNAHKPGEETVLEKATCSDPGLKCRYCTVCGAEIPGSRRVIPATGHTLLNVTDTEPTCLKEGSQHTECSVCGKILYSTLLYKRSHSFGEWAVSVAPTCAEKGEEKRTCIYCGYAEKRTVSSLPHTEETVTVKEPTCVKKGSAEKHCAVCGKTLKTGISVPATGHDYDAWQTTLAPTCEKNGKETRICRVCGNTENRNLQLTGHRFGDYTTVKNATCTENGEKQRVCSLCGKTEKSTVKKTGHSFPDWSVTKTATCTEKGEKERVCSLCSTRESREIPALNHKNSVWETTRKATVTQGGHQRKVCPDCGKILKEEDTPPQLMKNNTICAEGPRLRDEGISEDWYMYAPVDVSENSSTTLELVASNMFRVGTVNVLVQDGYVTVSLFIPSENVTVTQLFFTLVPDMRQLPSYQPEELYDDWALPFDEPLPLNNYFPDESRLCLYVCCRADYTFDSRLMTKLQ